MNALLMNLVQMLLKLVKPELLKKGVDALLDVIEKAVENSPNKVDDAIVLPLCKLIRSTFDVPDTD